MDHVEVEIADAQPTDLAGPQPAAAGQEQRYPPSLWDGGQATVQLVEDGLEQSVAFACWVGVFRIPAYLVEFSAAVISLSGRLAQVGRIVRRSSFA